MGWITTIAIFLGVATGVIALRRFLRHRYHDLYADDDPPYQDPQALPTPPGPTGGLS